MRTITQCKKEQVGIENFGFSSRDRPAFENYPEAGSHWQQNVNQMGNSAIQQQAYPPQPYDYWTRGNNAYSELEYQGEYMPRRYIQPSGYYSKGHDNYPENRNYPQQNADPMGNTAWQAIRGKAIEMENNQKGNEMQQQVQQPLVKQQNQGMGMEQNEVIGTENVELKFTKAYILACIVYWLFSNPIIGGVAYIFAIMGDDKNRIGDFIRARTMLRTSYCMSIGGIFFSIFFFVIFALNFTKRY